jgi:hypothetical protein
MSTKSPDFNFLQAAIAGLSEERRCPAESLAPSTDRDWRGDELTVELWNERSSRSKQHIDAVAAAAYEDFKVCCIMDKVRNLRKRLARTKISEPLRE